MERLNNYIFFKKGLSFVNHLVPFTIISILSLFLSLPSGDLLIKLASKLDNLNISWVIAVFVTCVSIYIYFLSILSQIKKAYLFPYRNFTKAIITCLFFIALCTSIAFIVLMFSKRLTICEALTIGNIFASLLLASISLIGVGWKLPSLVETIGIKLPDYTEAHNSIKDIEKILDKYYLGNSSDIISVKDYFNKIDKLLNNIEKERDFEPPWAKTKIESVEYSLKSLIEEGKCFLKPGEASNLAPVIRGQITDGRYKSFLTEFKKLISFWPEWS